MRFSKDDLRLSQLMVEKSRTLVDLESTYRQVAAEEINVRGILTITLLFREKM